jgi:hypothetical protein
MNNSSSKKNRSKRNKRNTANNVIRPVLRQPIQTIQGFLTPFPMFLGTAGITNGYSAVFALSSLANSANWQAVFDQYRIVLVEAMLIPVYTDIVINAAGSLPSGLCITAVDYDDATVPTTSGNLTGHDSCKITNWTSQHNHTFKPRVAEAVYGGGAFTSYGNTATWIDTSSPNVQHYGMKVLLDSSHSTMTAATLIYQLTARLTIEFRNPI